MGGCKECCNAYGQLNISAHAGRTSQASSTKAAHKKRTGRNARGFAQFAAVAARCCWRCEVAHRVEDGTRVERTELSPCRPPNRSSHSRGRLERLETAMARCTGRKERQLTAGEWHTLGGSLSLVLSVLECVWCVVCGEDLRPGGFARANAQPWEKAERAADHTAELERTARCSIHRTDRWH